MSDDFAGQLEINGLDSDVEFDLAYIRRQNETVRVDDSITMSQRMTSACIGSLITSLVVTPFDVVRVRVQQQEMLPSSKPCCGGGGAMNSIKNLPKEASPELFWLSHHYCSSAEGCARINSTFQGFFVISRNEGLATLWRGLSLTLLMAIPSNVIYFSGYEYARDNSPFSKHPANPLVCGSFARLLAATCVAPFELIKTRLQSIPSSSGADPNILANLIRDTLKTVKTDGIRTLFTGLQITLWRDVPFSGIYWLCYEWSKSKIANFINHNKNESERKSKEELKIFLTSFLAGSISGTVGSIATHPFDVGKTRLQIVNEQHYEQGKRTKRPSMFKFLAQIYRREGYKALTAGLGPRTMKIAPSCAIMISSYEIGKKYFKESRIQHASN